MIAKIVRISKTKEVSVIGVKFLPSHPSIYKGLSHSEAQAALERIERSERKELEHEQGIGR